MSILVGRFGLVRRRRGYTTFQRYGGSRQKRIRGRGMRRRRRRFY